MLIEVRSPHSQVLLEKRAGSNFLLRLALLGADARRGTRGALQLTVLQIANTTLTETTARTWEAGRWYHFEAQVAAANNDHNEVYVDGVLATSSRNNERIASSASFAAPLLLGLGSVSSRSAPESAKLQGAIDTLYLRAVRRPAAAVQTLAQALRGELISAREPEALRGLGVAVEVKLSSPAALPIQARVRVGGTAALGRDLLLEQAAVSFAPGATGAWLHLDIVGDFDDEPDEVAELSLVDLRHARPGALPTTTILIEDDDKLPKLRFSRRHGRALESDGTASVSVALSAASLWPVEVDFTVSGTAAHGEDHLLQGGTLRFAPGQREALIEVPLVDDLVSDQDRRLDLALGAPSQGGLGSPRLHSLSILDDEPRLLELEPRELPLEGGHILLRGHRLDKVVAVEVGGQPCAALDVASDTTLSCDAPSAAQPTTVDLIAATARGGRGTWPRALSYFAGVWRGLPDPDRSFMRWGHVSVWTGQELIIWGGQDASCPEFSCTKADGMAYDPAADSWRDLAPSVLGPRTKPSSCWSQSEVLIFGGMSGGGTGGIRSDGARYDPRTDSWTPMAAPPFAGRQDTEAVWTGKEMLVWGGQNAHAWIDGGAYNPTTDTWRYIPAAPRARWRFDAVWTGQEMIVFGGTDGDYGVPTHGFYGDGDAWNPRTQSWRHIAESSLGARYGIDSVGEFLAWTGRALFVGPTRASAPEIDTALYDPRQDTWRRSTAPPAALAQSCMPSSSVWIGDAVLSVIDDAAALYRPEQDAWLPLAAPPEWRRSDQGVWTGSELLACYGVGSYQGPDCRRLELGPFHNRMTSMAPATWLPISTAQAPSPRLGHSAVWNGVELIVWGGRDGGQALADGGRYDPWHDVWTPVSTEGAPVPRSDHSAVWTGAEMIFWGGLGSGASNGALASGGRYDPWSDTWAEVSVEGAPSPRSEHRVAWTGAEMIVWGGRDGEVALDDGARYDPWQDAWSPMSAEGAPGPRAGHAMVYTGHEVFVWGGGAASGALYRPDNDTWRPVAAEGAPSDCAHCQTLWLGHQVLLWGRAPGTGTGGFTSSLYDPAADSWAPNPAQGHRGDSLEQQAVWTGQRLLVCSPGPGAQAVLESASPFDSEVQVLDDSSLLRCDGHAAAWTGYVGDGRGNGALPYQLNESGDTGRLLLWGGSDADGPSDQGAVYRP